MKLILHKKLKDIKTKLVKLFNDSEIISPYQSYDFLSNLFKGLQYNSFYKYIRFKIKIRFAEVVGDDNKTILIMPLEIGSNFARPIPTYDVYDVIAGKSEDKEIVDAIEYLMSNFDSDFMFPNVTEYTRLYKILKNCKNAELIDEHGCGTIMCHGGGYEQYYQSLSKSSRQNLRTAYNRLEKDNFKYEMSYYFGRVKLGVKRAAKSLYIKRYREKNNIRKFHLKDYLKRLCDPISKICANSDTAFHAFLKIDNQVAALMSGFVLKDKITIPRLVFNSKFSKYSPGIILINETIKDIIFKKGFKYLDLGYGDENYKFVMGATPYTACDFIIKRK